MADYCLTVTGVNGAYAGLYTVGQKVTLAAIGEDAWAGGNFSLVKYPGVNDYQLEESLLLGLGFRDNIPDPTGAWGLDAGDADHLDANISEGPCAGELNTYETRITQIILEVPDPPERKVLTDSIAVSEEVAVGVSMAETVALDDSGGGPQLTREDAVALVDLLVAALLKESMLDAVLVSELLSVSKNFVLAEMIQLLESISVRVSTGLKDGVTLVESISGGLAPLQDSIVISDQLDISTSLSEFIQLIESLKVGHGLTESISSSDELSQQIAKALQDLVSSVDRFYLEAEGRYTESIRLIDQLLKGLFFLAEDNVWAVDQIWNALVSKLDDAVTVHEVLTIDEVELIIGCEVTLTVDRRPTGITRRYDVPTFSADEPVVLERC